MKRLRKVRNPGDRMGIRLEWTARGGAALLLLGGLAGCDDPTLTPPALDATSQVAGVVYLDLDGNEALSGPDEPVEEGIVLLSRPSGGDVLGTDTTSALGEFLFEDVPVGSVEISLDPGFLGDSLLEVPLDSSVFRLRADAGLAVALGVTFPQRSVAEARTTDPGTRIFTQGVVLNPRGQAPGGAIHIEGSGQALRILVPPAVQAAVGDSVRILGTVNRDNGQPAINDARLFRVDPGARDVTPRPTTIAQALAARDGRDAALVEITEGLVVREDTVPEGFRVSIAEGGDTLVARLRIEQGFLQSGIPSGAGVIRLVGLLLYDPVDDVWDVVPRTGLDLRFAPPPPPDPPAP